MPGKLTLLRMFRDQYGRVMRRIERSRRSTCNPPPLRKVVYQVPMHRLVAVPNPWGKDACAYDHHGFSPVLKSVSVHGENSTLPSAISTCAKANDKGAGPRTTRPWLLYWEPWHGQMNLFSALLNGTTQPKCVQTAFTP
jgi:hypothetical protein